MSHQTLLFIADPDTSKDEFQKVLSEADATGDRVVCLLLDLMPQQPMNAYGYFPYNGGEIAGRWVKDVETSQTKIRDAKKATEVLLTDAGISGDVQASLCALTDARKIVAQHALLCDVVALSDHLREEEPELFDTAVHAVLFDSPASLVLNGLATGQPDRIFIAWNSDLPGARAIHKALPLLTGASEVLIAVIDPTVIDGDFGQEPGADLARWLSHHGCNVTVAQYPSGGVDVTETIKRRAAEFGADMVVMGAFGRSKLAQVVFGGTTRSMLKQTELPVFMAH